MGTNFNVLSPIGGWTARLSIGVPVFFALSGFLLYRPFVVARRLGGPPVDIRRYYRRRLVRIVPAYWVVIACVILVPGLVAVNTALAPLRTDDLWRYALFLQVYDDRTSPFGIGQAWTLCVEVAFYALLPLLAWAAAWARSLAWELCGLLTLAGISVAVRLLTHAAGDHLPSVWLVGTFAWLACGMVLAVLSVEAQRGRLRAAPLSTCWAMAVLVYIACAHGGLPRGPADPYSTVEFAGEHLGYTAFTFLVLAPLVIGTPRENVTRVANWGVVRWLGAVSYGLYLWHIIILFVLLDRGALNWWPGNSMLVMTPIMIVVGIFLGTASYILVERPALRLEARRSARRAAPVVVTLPGTTARPDLAAGDS